MTRPRTAVASTVLLGACDVAAIRFLLTEARLHKARPDPIDVGALARYDRPMPSIADYDALLISTPCVGNRMMQDLQDQAIRQHCKALRMPTIGGQFARLAEAATREGQSHVGYLEALLTAEMEEREGRAIARLLHEAKLPQMKTLDAFEFDRVQRLGRSTAHAGGRRLCGQGRTNPVDGRSWHQKPIATDFWSLRPSAAAGAVHHRDRADQRTGRGRARQPTQPRARLDGNGSI